MNAKGNGGKKRKIAKVRPVTIYDGDKYFDVKFSEAERRELKRHIAAAYGCHDEIMGPYFLWGRTNRELCHALNDWSIPEDWAYIHICRQLEIDYKAFAKNVPKLPIEPFYRFVESRFRDFRPAKNKLQLDIQTRQIYSAFYKWIEAQCESAGCAEPYHDHVCQDRYERLDCETAAKRIWEHNRTHPAFPALKLVHSA
jgi:hypothetical protein